MKHAVFAVLYGDTMYYTCCGELVMHADIAQDAPQVTCPKCVEELAYDVEAWLHGAAADSSVPA